MAEQLKPTETGENFQATSVGKFSNLIQDHKGKLFVKDSIGLTSCELSFGALPPKGEVPFLHTHKNNEEVYVIQSGVGQFYVDGKVFPISEGSVVRVSPAGKRSLRNTSETENLVYYCIQAQQNSLKTYTMNDGDILQGKINWE